MRGRVSNVRVLITWRCTLASVWLKVRIDVVPLRPEGEVSEPEATAAAREAVFNALQAAEETGFDHDPADVFSLLVDYVEATDFDPTIRASWSADRGIGHAGGHECEGTGEMVSDGKGDPRS